MQDTKDAQPSNVVPLFEGISGRQFLMLLATGQIADFEEKVAQFIDAAVEASFERGDFTDIFLSGRRPG